MPRQVPFTEYEAALLLDAYLKTLSGEKERMESVRDCSLQLRQMALNAGSEIDDIYRMVFRFKWRAWSQHIKGIQS